MTKARIARLRIFGHRDRTRAARAANVAVHALTEGINERDLLERIFADPLPPISRAERVRCWCDDRRATVRFRYQRTRITVRQWRVSPRKRRETERALEELIARRTERVGP
ncbi:hypothetical protein ACFQ67_27350 [Streptomyces sp. NPDC056488]|uniref:hypothetical protein n=1 Tax=Streptomyces sp. NPDC056488 TaxID=3345836 RepID=UPI0036912DEA